jgi:chitodextrinase
MNRVKISTVETGAIPQPPPALNFILKRAKQGQVSAVEAAIDVDMEAEEQPSPKPAPTLNQIIKRARFVGLNGKK